MTGWNLPPGCEIYHIPGNRPIDILYEKESEIFCKNCNTNELCYGDLDICSRSHEFKKHFESILNLY